MHCSVKFVYIRFTQKEVSYLKTFASAKRIFTMHNVFKSFTRYEPLSVFYVPFSTLQSQQIAQLSAQRIVHYDFCMTLRVLDSIPARSVLSALGTLCSIDMLSMD